MCILKVCGRMLIASDITGSLHTTCLCWNANQIHSQKFVVNFNFNEITQLIPKSKSLEFAPGCPPVRPLDCAVMLAKLALVAESEMIRTCCHYV